MTCNKCGAQTPRSGLCKACGRDERESRRGGRRQPLPDDAQDMHCDACDRYLDVWSFSPHGRPYCPSCGAIPEGAQREIDEVVMKIDVRVL